MGIGEPQQLRAEKADRVATNVFAALLIIGFYYLAYRYPFRINSSITSPTYIDTPASLQIAKYILIGIVLCVAGFTGAVIAGQRERLQDGAKISAVLVMTMAVFAVAKGALMGSLDDSTLGIILFVGVALSSLSIRWRLDAVRLARYVSVYAVVVVVVEAIQVLLYRTQGRLPALAYEGSVSVRFGSILDDPNGFALLVPLLLPVVWISWRNHRAWRLLISAGLLGSLILTYSFTGIVSFGLALIIGYVMLRWRSPGRMLTLFWAAVTVAVGVWVYLANSEFFASLLVSKQGSFGRHVSSITKLSDLGLPAVFGFGTPDSFIEASYLSLLANFGLLFVLAYTLIGLVAIVRLGRIITGAASSKDVALHYGMFFFLIAFLIGSTNLHLDGVFPVNLLYVLAVATSWFVPAPTTAVEEPSPAAATVPARVRR